MTVNCHIPQIVFITCFVGDVERRRCTVFFSHERVLFPVINPLTYDVTMISIIPFLFLMLLIPFVFLGLSQGIEMSEAQRLARRKMLICVAVCLPLFLLLLFIVNIVPIGRVEKIFLTVLFPIPCITVLLCCHRLIHRHSYNTISTIVTIVVFGIIFTSIVAMGTWDYRISVDTERKVQEIQSQRLSPAIPPPDETLEERIERLKSRLVPDVSEIDE